VPERGGGRVGRGLGGSRAGAVVHVRRLASRRTPLPRSSCATAFTPSLSLADPRASYRRSAGARIPRIPPRCLFHSNHVKLAMLLIDC